MAKQSKLDALVSAARTGDKYSVGEAFDSIRALGANARPAAAAMRELVDDKEPRRSIGARAVLAVIGENVDAHLDAIVAACVAKSGDTKAVARTTLSALDALAAAALERAMQDDRPKLRSAAVGLAGSTVPIRSAVRFDRVVALLEDADDTVREHAVMTVRQFVAPTAPAKPNAKLTPALKARIVALRGDRAPKVAAMAERLAIALSL
jgi:hypothetical protein